MQTKRCSRCKESKPVYEFYRDRSRKDGLNNSCKRCVHEKSCRYREANKEKVAEGKRRWKRGNRKQRRRESAKYRQEANSRSLELAHRQGLPWEDWEEKFVLADNELTNYQKAVKLGRTYGSVITRKKLLRKSTSSELTHDTVRV